MMIESKVRGHRALQRRRPGTRRPATAAWQATRRGRSASLVRARVVMWAGGASAGGLLTMCLRVCVVRVTVTGAGRAVAIGGAAVWLGRPGGPSLATVVLYC